jgi:20S proteasome subunit beta 6
LAFFFSSGALSSFNELVFPFVGRGAVYNFDVVGSYQRVPVACVGSGESLIQPLLDNQIDRAHQQGLGRWEPSELEAVELVKDAFSSAGERDIHTGDHVRICIINKDGVREEIFDLKYD